MGHGQEPTEGTMEDAPNNIAAFLSNLVDLPLSSDDPLREGHQVR